MVEVLAVASGKGGTGKTTSTLALGMALSEEYDVTVVDADTGMANLLFHAGLADVETTLHDVLAADAPVEAAVYDRFGMGVVPCGTSLAGFRDADPTRLRDVVADLAADTDVLLLDSAAALGSRAAVLPIVLADRVVVVLQPTIPSLSDGLKVQEYARTYAARAARRAGKPLLAHAPNAPAADAFREAAAAIDVAAGESGPVADRFRSAVIPDQP